MSANHRDALHLDEQVRAREARDGDQGARREIVTEDLAAQLREAVAQPRIGDEDGHRHHIGEPAAGLFERTAEPREDLAHLAVEIGGERTAAAVLAGDLPGQPHDAPAFGDDRLRIAARLRPRVFQIAAFAYFRHRVLPQAFVYTAAMQAAPLPDFDKAQARAAAWLAAWDRQGPHRTGTAGDLAGAEWLGREAMALGGEVWIEEFALDRLDPVECYVEFGVRQLAAVPMFDAPGTDPQGVGGLLGAIGSDAEIGVAELSPRAVYTGEFERIRRDSRHRALVIVCAGDRPGMGLLNAEQFRHPYGPPTVHVSSTDRPAVFEAIAQRRPARLVSVGERKPTKARNVVITVQGTKRDRPPLVVMTPRSSWWQSTAERGGGIACWLESLRALLAAPPACDVVCTANSGHELGHLGLDDFVARHPGWDRPPAEGGATWVHYGANIGAAGGRLSVVSPADDLRELAARELANAGQPPEIIAPKGLVPSGETRDIHRAGGRYLTLVGTNPFFHLPQDRWPHAVDAAAVARIAAAMARLILRLTR